MKVVDQGASMLDDRIIVFRIQSRDGILGLIVGHN